MTAFDISTATDNVAAVIVAAGRGLRAGGDMPKQWQLLNGAPVLAHTLHALRSTGRIGHFVVVIHPDDSASADSIDASDVTFVFGGATRADSVRFGLEALADTAPELVLIHDAARPLVSQAVVDRVLAALNDVPAAAPALEVADALWHGDNGVVSGTQDRSGLWRAQTPQGFRFADILAAHRALEPDDSAPTPADDVVVARAAGLEVTIVAGDESNFKITRPGDLARASDLARAEEMMKGSAMVRDIRMGNGYDVHRFGPGDYVTLCGVVIPFDQGLMGHSDADVGMHAVTDALYGALAAGDIGTHFPPSDPQWKGAASHIFLAHACDMARGRGYVITHVDVTLVCEMPKIGPHASSMRVEMARIMGLAEDAVSVKATTSERLGFTGRGEGIAALATATLVKF